MNIIKENGFKNKCLNNAQENTNWRLLKMGKTTQDLKIEFKQQIEILKKTHAKMEMNWKT